MDLGQAVAGGESKPPARRPLAAPPKEAAGPARDPIATRLLALALLIALLRLLAPQPSFWFDEALTAGDALAPRPGLNHNSLFYRLSALSVALCGGRLHEVSLRLPALLCSLALPLALYWALFPALGRRVAAFAALLAALSPWTLYWAVNARAYGVALLPATLGLGFLLRERKGAALAGLALMGLAGALHLSFLVLPAAYLLAALLPRRLSGGPALFRPAQVFGLVGGALALFWAWPILLQYLSQKGEISGIAGLRHFALASGYALSPLLGLAALAGGIHPEGATQGVRRRLAWTAVLGALCVLALGFVGQTTAQYVFALLPAVLGLAASTLTLRPLPLRRSLLTLLVASLALTSIFDLTFGHQARSRWREAIAWIESRRGPDDFVLAAQAGLYELYARPGFVDARSPLEFLTLDRTRPTEILTAARDCRTTWILLRPDFLQKWPAEDRLRLEEVLASHGELLQRFPVPALGRDLELLVYRLAFAGP